MRSYQFIWERVNIAGLDVRRLVLRWGMAGALKPGSCFLLQEIFLRLETFDPQPHTNLTSVAFPLFEETFSGNHREIFDHHLLDHFCFNINTSRIRISAHLFCDCWYHGGAMYHPTTYKHNHYPTGEKSNFPWIFKVHKTCLGKLTLAPLLWFSCQSQRSVVSILSLLGSHTGIPLPTQTIRTPGNSPNWFTFIFAISHYSLRFSKLKRSRKCNFIWALFLCTLKLIRPDQHQIVRISALVNNTSLPLAPWSLTA